MNSAEDTLEGKAFRFDFVDTVSREKITTMTVYAEDQSHAVAKAYDHAGARGWLDVKVRPSMEECG